MTIRFLYRRSGIGSQLKRALSMPFNLNIKRELKLISSACFRLLA